MYYYMLLVTCIPELFEKNKKKGFSLKRSVGPADYFLLLYFLCLIICFTSLGSET